MLVTIRFSIAFNQKLKSEVCFWISWPRPEIQSLKVWDYDEFKSEMFCKYEYKGLRHLSRSMAYSSGTNFFTTDKLFTPMNTIYLTSKRYIFRVSKQEKILDIKEYQEYLNTVYTEQEYLAKLQFKHATFLKIWSSF